MQDYEYIIKRKKFYNQIPQFWSDMYGQEYALYDLKKVKKNKVKHIRTASRRISEIFHKTAHLLRYADDETLLTLGFTESVMPFIRLKTIKPETVISRLDLVEIDGTYKVLELNADTPTFIKELFYVNGKVCDEFHVHDPNHLEEKKLAKAVTSAIREASSYCRNKEDPYIVFTSHHENEEDQNTTKYLQRLAGVQSKFIPLSKLRIVASEGLFDEEGRKIDVLYRQTYPIEQLIEDRSEQDEKIGEMLLELVVNKQLSLINPPSAFLLQSKAVQAAIWGLHEEKSTFFTKKEHEWIAEYFLPTYLENDPFLESGQKYVKKPSFGREGDTVEVYDPNGEMLFADKNKSYKQFLPVYQKYVDLPMSKFTSEKGEMEGYVMIGCFLLNGIPSAVGLRIGNRITDNLSYYLPIGME